MIDHNDSNIAISWARKGKEDGEGRRQHVDEQLKRKGKERKGTLFKCLVVLAPEH